MKQKFITSEVNEFVYFLCHSLAPPSLSARSTLQLFDDHKLAMIN
jgi:hypothetical protein